MTQKEFSIFHSTIRWLVYSALGTSGLQVVLKKMEVRLDIPEGIENL
jgi:hypothetical protein